MAVELRARVDLGSSWLHCTPDTSLVWACSQTSPSHPIRVHFADPSLLAGLLPVLEALTSERARSGVRASVAASDPAQEQVSRFVSLMLAGRIRRQPYVMAMGTRRKRERQQDLWIASSDVVETPANIFYDRLNQILDEYRFDAKVEWLCEKFYKKSAYGRPSMTPGVYFRSLLIGFFEGIDSERGIAWRTADSLSLRKFLGYALDEATPDHSTISRTRRLYWLETHKAVFRWC